MTNSSNFTAQSNPPESSDFGPKGLTEAVKASQTASFLLQVYTHTVKNTPDIILDPAYDTKIQSDPPISKALPAHQKQARETATHFLSVINPLLQKKALDITGFYGYWKNEIDTLKTLAADITAPGNADSLKQGVQLLIDWIKQMDQQTEEARKKIDAVSSNIEADMRNLEADVNNITIAFEGADGEIGQLVKLISGLHHAIASDTEILAASGIGILIGGITILVGILAEFATLGTSTAVVVGGILVVAGSATAMGIVGADLNQKNIEFANATRELNIDHAIVASAHTIAKTIAQLQKSLSDGIAAMDAIDKSWSLLSGKLEQTIDDLDLATPDTGVWLLSTLKSADDEWKSANSIAQDLASIGSLSVKKITLSSAA